MSRWFANARMYSVDEVTRSHWRRLLGAAFARADLPWTFVDHPAPAPLELLWAREDLGLVMMCGLPFAQRTPRPTLVAAPIPSPARYGGLARYCTDIVVRADAPWQCLSDTVGAVAGYTLADSFSGGVAFADHLSRVGPTAAGSVRPPYRATVGGLVNARGIIDALADGRIDVGPLDSYCHDLLRRHEPALAAQVRTIDRTAWRPIPPLVATAPIEDGELGRLRSALHEVARNPAQRESMDLLLLAGFAEPEASTFEPLAALGRRVLSDFTWEC